MAFAVGIGSATAIFTVVNGVLLEPLPYPGGGQLRDDLGDQGRRRAEPGTFIAMSDPELPTPRLRRHRRFGPYGRPSRSDGARRRRARAGRPDRGQLLPAARRRPALGRLIGPEDDTPTAPRVAVLSYGFFQTRFAGDVSVIGRTLMLDGTAYTVVGVLPAEVRVTNRDVIVTLWPARQSPRMRAATRAYYGIGRLKPGVSLEQARADLQVYRERPESIRGAIRSRPGGEPRMDLSGLRDLRSTLLLLFGAAGLLLLISCANVATLLLARSVARARETAIRGPPSAHRDADSRFSYFIEGLYVSTAGAMAGILRAIASGSPRGVGRVGLHPARRRDGRRLEGPVLRAWVGVRRRALSSLAPLWQAIRTAPNDVLTEGVRASAGARHPEAFDARSSSRDRPRLHAARRERDSDRPSSNPHPRCDRVRSRRVDVPAHPAGCRPDVPAASAHQTRLVEALEVIPSVSRAGFANQLPLDGCASEAPFIPRAARRTRSVGSGASA